MKQEINTLDGILDIALPLAPADSGWSSYTLIAVMILLSGVVAAIAYRWWVSPRQHSQRKLAKLLHQHKYGHFNTRDAVFRLAEILRVHMLCHQLSSRTGLPMHLQDRQLRWSTFLNELDAKRYSVADVEEISFIWLANEAQFWLKKW